MDGTPIYDIKPYLSYVDSHPEARGGFTDTHQWQHLQVIIPDDLRPCYDEEQWRTIEEILSLDPRPHYHEDLTGGNMGCLLQAKISASAYVMAS